MSENKPSRASGNLQTVDLIKGYQPQVKPAENVRFLDGYQPPRSSAASPTQPPPKKP